MKTKVACKYAICWYTLEFLFSNGNNLIMTERNHYSGKMGVSMPLLWITLAISVLGSNAAGVFSVLHSPESLKFVGSSKTFESLLKEIFSASLGLSVEENSEWDGLSIIDPFNTPEAVVEVYIDGISTLGEASGPNSTNYPLIVDEYEPDTYDAVKHRIKQRVNKGDNKLVNINLNDPNDLAVASKAFGQVAPPKIVEQIPHFKYDSIDEDFEFLYEIQVLNEITEKVRSGAVSADNKVDFYYIRFRSLHALSDFHGPNSVQTKEAKRILGESLQALSAAFNKAYDGSVLVTAVTTDVEHTRRTRQAPGDSEGSVKETNEDQQLWRNPDPEEIGSDSEDTPRYTTTPSKTTTKPPPKTSTSAPKTNDYTADYAAIFNIILWSTIVFVFSLIAIVYSFMDMDPGRDSIIYRMTSTRMKKDN